MQSVGYRNAFEDVEGVHIVGEPAGCRSNYWLQTLQLDNDNLALRDAVLEALVGAGYKCRPIWTPIHKLKPYSACPHAPLTVTESLERRLINLPSSAELAGRI